MSPLNFEIKLTPTPEKIMTVAYLRVSTQRQTVEHQRYEIQKFAKTKGLTVQRWEMEAASGTKSKEERSLGGVLKRLRKNDILIISEISRLSRKMLEIMSILHTCIERKIILYSIKEGYEFGNTMNSKIMGFAFSISAEIERNLISMRTKEALALRKEQGVILGRPKNSCSRQALLEENHQEIDRMIAEGIPLARIARTYRVARNTLYTYLKRKNAGEHICGIEPSPE